jgi:hypothetical protein
VSAAGKPDFPVSSRLWSLGEMLRVYADQFIRLGERIMAVKITLAHTEHLQVDPGRPLTEEERAEMDKDLAHLQDTCNELGLPIAFRLVGKLRDSPSETMREFQVLVEAVSAELDGRLVLYVPPRFARFYENPEILSELASASFPTPHKELIESGTCLAAGLPTASVFHAMRAAEIGVRIYGKSLNDSFPDKPLEMAEWHQIIDQCDSKIKAIGQQPKSN